MSNITLEELDKNVLRNKEDYDALRRQAADDDWLWSAVAEAEPRSYPCVAIIQPVMYNNDAGTAVLNVIYVYPSDFD